MLQVEDLNHITSALPHHQLGCDIVAWLQEDASERAPSEGAALEMASVLAAIAATSGSLGPYLSPYLPRLLALLPCAPLLACHSAGCSAAAQAILSQLATAIPARLLLAPLAAQLPASLQVRISQNASASLQLRL